MDHVPASESGFGERGPQEVFVHEDVHVLPPLPRLVDDAVPDPRERPVERPEERRDVVGLEDDLVLSVRVRSKRRRDPHGDPGPGDLVG